MKYWHRIDDFRPQLSCRKSNQCKNYQSLCPAISMADKVDFVSGIIMVFFKRLDRINEFEVKKLFDYINVNRPCNHNRGTVFVAACLTVDDNQVNYGPHCSYLKPMLLWTIVQDEKLFARWNTDTHSNFWKLYLGLTSEQMSVSKRLNQW